MLLDENWSHASTCFKILSDFPSWQESMINYVSCSLDSVGWSLKGRTFYKRSLFYLYKLQNNAACQSSLKQSHPWSLIAVIVRAWSGQVQVRGFLFTSNLQRHLWYLPSHINFLHNWYYHCFKKNNYSVIEWKYKIYIWIMLNVYYLINSTKMNEQPKTYKVSFLKQTYELLKLYLLVTHSTGHSSIQCRKNEIPISFF